MQYPDLLQKWMTRNTTDPDELPITTIMSSIKEQPTVYHYIKRLYHAHLPFLDANNRALVTSNIDPHQRFEDMDIQSPPTTRHCTECNKSFQNQLILRCPQCKQTTAHGLTAEDKDEIKRSVIQTSKELDERCQAQLQEQITTAFEEQQTYDAAANEYIQTAMDSMHTQPSTIDSDTITYPNQLPSTTNYLQHFQTYRDKFEQLIIQRLINNHKQDMLHGHPLPDDNTIAEQSTQLHYMRDKLLKSGKSITLPTSSRTASIQT